MDKVPQDLLLLVLDYLRFLEWHTIKRVNTKFNRAVDKFFQNEPRFELYVPCAKCNSYLYELCGFPIYLSYMNCPQCNHKACAKCGRLFNIYGRLCPRCAPYECLAQLCTNINKVPNQYCDELARK